jgi:hypothetical protein
VVVNSYVQSKYRVPIIVLIGRPVKMAIANWEYGAIPAADGQLMKPNYYVLLSGIQVLQLPTAIL